MVHIKKYQKYLLILLKVVIFGFTIFYVYSEVFHSAKFRDLISEVKIRRNFDLVLIAISIVLVFFNWGVEAIKWKFLISKIQKISFRRAWKAVLSGVTISTLLPNRSGEYLGRVLYLSSHRTIKAIIATLVGNFAQLLVTIIVGSAGFLLFLAETDQNDFYFAIILFTVSFLNFLLLMIYFNIHLIKRLLPQGGSYQKISKYINVVSYYHSSGLSTVLFWSLLRYLIFLGQYSLLLFAFGAELSLYHAIISISAIFLAQSVIPTIALTEIGVRGAVAVHFLGSYIQKPFSILSAAYSLWIINLIIPALAGAFFILFSKKARRRSRRYKTPLQEPVVNKKAIN